mmetsp:Transcript_60531/g.148515  ORF Transcript_60531/g.148515 Transcript_60531/m.148515 type:complete len:536 (-) Transcript_60531:54-1661(-)
MDFIYTWLQSVGLVKEDPPPIFPTAVRYQKGGVGKILSLSEIYRVPPLASERYATAYSTSETEIILGQGSFGTCRLVKLVSTTTPTPVTSPSFDNDNSAASTRTRGSTTSHGSANSRPRQAITEYACKSIPKLKTNDGTDYINRSILEEEVYNLCRCQGHPNIVKLVDVIEDRSCIHLLMEVCKGGELYSKVLEAKLKRKKASDGSTTAEDKTNKIELNAGLDEGVAVKICHQILSAICYCHDRNVGHRDLKASNFLLKTKEPAGSLCGTYSLSLPWTTRIIDFGLSKYVPPGSSPPPPPTRSSTVLHPTNDDEDDDEETNDEEEARVQHPDDDTTTAAAAAEKATEKTATDVSCSGDSHDELCKNRSGYMTSEVGTPYYTAPEVLTQDEYSLNCDVYSVGVVAFLVLSGTLPVMGRDERETVKMLMDPDLVVKFDGDVWRDNGPISLEAREFCKALLERDPTARPTAHEALGLDWMTKHFGPPPEVATRSKLIKNEDIVLPFLSKKTDKTDDGTVPASNNNNGTETVIASANCF